MKWSEITKLLICCKQPGSTGHVHLFCPSLPATFWLIVPPMVFFFLWDVVHQYASQKKNQLTLLITVHDPFSHSVFCWKNPSCLQSPDSPYPTVSQNLLWCTNCRSRCIENHDVKAIVFHPSEQRGVVVFDFNLSHSFSWIHADSGSLGGRTVDVCLSASTKSFFHN